MTSGSSRSSLARSVESVANIYAIVIGLALTQAIERWWANLPGTWHPSLIRP
jgi:preprotein translocase subunit Sec63